MGVCDADLGEEVEGFLVAHGDEFSAAENIFYDETRYRVAKIFEALAVND